MTNPKIGQRSFAYLLTSSQKFPTRTKVRTGIHGVFKRPHLSASSDNPEGSSPDRRRLRFSFQFNDVKDQNRLGRPHCLAPVVGGGGYLVAPVVRVNRPFQVIFS